MMKDAGHFDQIKRLRVLDKDLVPFASSYDVRALAESSHRADVYMIIFHSRLRLLS